MATVRQVLNRQSPPRPLSVLLSESDDRAGALDDWRKRGDVEWVRAQATNRPSVLRGAIESLLREFDATADEAVGVAAVVALQAFVLARTDQKSLDVAEDGVRVSVPRP